MEWKYPRSLDFDRFLVCCFSLFSLWLFLYSHPVLADADIRVADPFSSRENQSFILSLTDCRELVQVRQGELVLVPSQARQRGAFGCEFDVQVSGAERFNPAFKVEYLDHTDEVTETFQHESVQPSIEINSVAIEQLEDQQQLIVELQAQDNVDITKISVDVTGLRASDLTQFGGVVDAARQKAFVTTLEPVVVYPSVENQSLYQAVIPLNQNLSAEALFYEISQKNFNFS